MQIGQRKKLLKWSVIGCVAMLVLAAVGYPYVLRGPEGEGTVKIMKGASLQAVTDSVAAVAGGSYATRVKRMLGITGYKPGETNMLFRVKKGESPLSFARRVGNGAQDGVRFTFNNVRTLDEWSARWGEKFLAGKDSMLQALRDSAVCASVGKTPATVACLLLPDSYEFLWSVTPEKMLEGMKNYYDKFWDSDRQEKAKALGLSPDEVVVLASIVEEETAKSDERGKVARLYLNRLQQGMRLQADPTVKFALGDFTLQRITAAMTQTDSPYNTYRVNGLPPGPIRLPEKATIDAVLNAPQHDYTYMCAKEDFSGYHNFTSSYEEHLANAKRYQNALNAKNIK